MIWPALTGILSVLTARRLWSNGQHAALVMAGSMWLIANSHLDSGLIFFLALTLCAFLWSQHDQATAAERRLWHVAGMGVDGRRRALKRTDRPAHPRRHAGRLSTAWSTGTVESGGACSGSPLVALFLLLCAPWFVLVSTRNPASAHFFIHEHVKRFLSTTHGRIEPVWFFVSVLLPPALELAAAPCFQRC